MKEIYRYEVIDGDHIEAITVATANNLTRIAISDFEEYGSEDESEQTTIIELTNNAVKQLEQALNSNIQDKDYDAKVEGVSLSAVELEQLIDALTLSAEVLGCEVNQSEIPYGLIEKLKIKRSNLFDFTASE